MKKLIPILLTGFIITSCGPSISDACENIWDVCYANLAAQGETGTLSSESAWMDNCETVLEDDSDEKIECWSDAGSCDDWYSCDE